MKKVKIIMMVSIMSGVQMLVAAGPAAVNLGTASHFAVLAGTAITSTGGGFINGDIGLSPATGAGITGITTAQVNGVIYTVNVAGPAGSVVDPGLLLTAKNDLTAAYNDAAARTGADAVYTGAREIGGMSLTPGLYKFTSSAAITVADLSLTGGVNDVWIFQIGSTLDVGVEINVTLDGGAQARNIFWQVGSSATILSSANFKGTIMAYQSITMNAGSTLEGRALAREAAVTYNGQTNSLPVPEAPRFTDIYRTNSESMTVVLVTTPYFLLTLEACPDLLLTNWVTLTNDTPISSTWTYTDTTATSSVTQRFYRAFITP